MLREFINEKIEAKQMLVIGDTPHDVTCSRAIEQVLLLSVQDIHRLLR